MPGEGHFAWLQGVNELPMTAFGGFESPPFFMKALEDLPDFHETQTGQFSTQ